MTPENLEAIANGGALVCDNCNEARFTVEPVRNENESWLVVMCTGCAAEFHFRCQLMGHKSSPYRASGKGRHQGKRP